MTTNSDLKQGLGVHSMWGSTPSFDLLSHLHTKSNISCCSSNDKQQHTEEINILLAKPSDARHILHTLGRRTRHDYSGKINVFVLESEAEVLARHLLQLQLYLNASIPIRHRASLYLELYNSLLSKRGEDYVVQAGKQLGDLMYADGECSRYMLQVLDLTWLKQKERDSLHSIFSSWKDSSAESSFVDQDDSVKLLRDYRMRGFYGERFDW